MSEINDAVQIIRVGYDGIEIAFKLGSASVQTVKKAVSFLVSLLDHEKKMGKTNLRGLLEKGGDLEVLSFHEKDMKKFKKYAKKYGILYSTMPKASRKDKLVEVMFHSEAAPRVRMLAKKMDDAKLYKFDEYLQNGNQEYIEQLIKDFEKQKLGNARSHTDKESQIDARIDSLIHRVGVFATEKKEVSVESIGEAFRIPKEQAVDVVQKLNQMGMLKEIQKGLYKAAMDKEAFEKRLERYTELTNRMRQIAAAKDTNLTDITITKKLILEENDHAIKTRVPGMYGQNEGYIWIKKSDVMEIHDGKTLLTYLDRKKEYKIYSKDNRVLFSINGQKLYDQHYDRVENKVRERYQKAKQQERKTQKNKKPAQAASKRR